MTKLYTFLAAIVLWCCVTCYNGCLQPVVTADRVVWDGCKAGGL